MRLRLTLAGPLCLVAAAWGVAAVCGSEPERRTPTAVPTATPVGSTPVEREIAWDEAVALIMDCEVASGGQAHSRQVWLTLRDGGEATTVQPVLDDLFTVMRDAVEGGCEQVPLWTE